MDIYNPTIDDSNQVSISPPQEATPTVNINTDGSMVMLPPEVASTRASNAFYGMSGVINKTPEEVRSAITSGKEALLREQSSAEIDDKKATQRQKEILDLSSNPTPESLQQILKLSMAPIAKTDPQSVFEDLQAAKYINHFQTFNNGEDSTPAFPWVAELYATLPGPTSFIKDLAEEASKKYFFSQKMQEDMRATVSNQDWPGYIADIAKQALILYSEYKLRGNVEGTSILSSFFLGNNLEDQRRKLYSLPYDQFKQEYTRIINYLKQDNPQLAHKFAEAMTGQTLDAKTIDNLFSLFAPLEAAQLAKLGIKGTQGLLQFRKGVRDMVLSSPNFSTMPPDIAAATGIGNLGEAAVKRTAGKLTLQLEGKSDIVKDSIESLTTNFKNMGESIVSNPGNSGSELANRIALTMQRDVDTIVTDITDWMRVNRTPFAVSSEDFIRAYKDKIKGEFKHADNTVINVKDPIYNEVSNTYVYPVVQAKVDGEFWKDLRTVRAFAKDNNIVLRPTVTQEFNRINQEINAARKANKPTEALQAERARFQRDYKDQLSDPLATMPNTEGAVIKQEGGGFYIEHYVGQKETDPMIRNSLITPKASGVQAYKQELTSGKVSTSSPRYMFEGNLGQLFNWVRTPEETLPLAERQARKIIDHGPARLAKTIEGLIERFSEIPREYREDFKRFLVAGHNKIDPDTSIAGYWFKNPLEIKDFYLNNFNRRVSGQEIEAYFTYRTLNEYDLILRKILDYRNRSINGVQQIQVKLKGGESTKWFDAIKHEGYPGGKDNIAIQGKDGKWTVINADAPRTDKGIKTYIKDVQEGKAEVWRIWDPPTMPLVDVAPELSKNRIRYVLVYNEGVASKPISWNSIPTRGGGHIVPDYEQYIKQPIVYNEYVKVGKEVRLRSIYDGDRTIMPIDLPVRGREAVASMEEVRKAIKKGRWDEAEAAHNRSSLPFDWEEHRSWYKPSFAPDGTKLDPLLSPNHEIRLVPKNKNIAELDNNLYKSFDYIDSQGKQGNSFINGTTSGSDARMSMVEFTGRRDSYELMTIGDAAKGTQGNPIYSYIKAENIDPLTAMDRGLSRIINSVFLDDYKNFTTEHWLQRYGNYLKDDEGLIKSSPLAVFYDPKFLKGTPNPIYLQAMSERKKALDLIGRSNYIDTMLNEGAATLADTIYGATSNSKLAKIPANMLPVVRNPVAFMRSWATQLHMGFFNPASLFTQASTFTNIAAMSPRHAFSGTAAALMFGLTRINHNPEILNFMDKFAVDLLKNTDAVQKGFKTGQWLEATKLLESSGFYIVGNEHAYFNSPVQLATMKGAFSKYIQKPGMIPFTLGSGSTRVSAFYTSYLEYVTANPGKVIDRFAKEQILERASLLDHNMTRSSASMAHTGVMSIPFTFQSYAIRLAEMVWGKRLDPMTKLRLIGANALLYGVPLGLGITGIGSIIPQASYEGIRKSMLETGMPVKNETLQKALGTERYVPGADLKVTVGMEGFLALALATISGSGDPSKGTWYDFSRFGVKGIDAAENALWSDKSWWDIAGGVVLSDIKNINTQSKGLRTFALQDWYSDLLNWDSPKTAEKYKLTLRDFTDLANIPTTGAKATQVWKAVASNPDNLNALKWYNKNGSYAGNVTLPEALMSSIMGLNPIQLQDNFVKRDIMKEVRKNEDDAQKEFTHFMQRHIQAAQAGDYMNAQTYYRNALVVLGKYDVRQDRMSSFMSKAISGYESQFRQINFDLYTKYVTGNKYNEALQAYQKELQLRGNQ